MLMLLIGQGAKTGKRPATIVLKSGCAALADERAAKVLRDVPGNLPATGFQLQGGLWPSLTEHILSVADPRHGLSCDIWEQEQTLEPLSSEPRSSIPDSIPETSLSSLKWPAPFLLEASSPHCKAPKLPRS